MNIAKTAYRSPLRQEQASFTRQRILDSLSSLIEKDGSSESLTFKSVAAKAGVTEMTVYRHFPTREALLKGLWGRMTAQMGPGVRMPGSEADLLGGIRPIYEGFDKIPAQILASISTPQGREMRASMNEPRRKAYLAILGAVGGRRLTRKKRLQAAAILQLLQSAYAWASMKEQWDFSGVQAAQAASWASEVLLKEIKKGKI